MTVSVNDSGPRLACRRAVDDHVTDVKGTTNNDDVTDVKGTTKDDHGKSDDLNCPGWSCRDRPGWSSRCSARAKSQHQHSRPTNTLPGCPCTRSQRTASCLSPTTGNTAAATRHRSTGGKARLRPIAHPTHHCQGAYLHTRGITSLTVCHSPSQPGFLSTRKGATLHKTNIASDTVRSQKRTNTYPSSQVGTQPSAGKIQTRTTTTPWPQDHAIPVHCLHAHAIV